MKTVEPLQGVAADEDLPLLVKRVCRNAAAGVVMVSALLALLGTEFRVPVGLLAGGLTGLALLSSLYWQVRSLSATAQEQRRMRFGFFQALVKYPIVGVALYQLFRYKLVNPLAFASGFVLIQVLLVVTVIVHLRDRTQAPAP